MADLKYIGYPEARQYASPDKSSDVLNKLLWGDYVTILDADSEPDFVKIKGRGKEGWVERKKLQENKLLEICFVDVGQGDGCLLVTPDDKFILIDAGKGDNMLRFLNWRFNLKKRATPLPIEMIIITHSDQDHYGGFDEIVNHEKIEIKKIYHNGLVERTGDDLLGPKEEINNRRYLKEVIRDIHTLKALLDVSANRGSKYYPKLLHDAYDKKGITNIQMLEKESVVENFGNYI